MDLDKHSHPCTSGQVTFSFNTLPKNGVLEIGSIVIQYCRMQRGLFQQWYKYNIVLFNRSIVVGIQNMFDFSRQKKRKTCHYHPVYFVFSISTVFYSFSTKIRKKACIAYYTLWYMLTKPSLFCY